MVSVKPVSDISPAFFLVNSGLMANVKKAFTGEVREICFVHIILILLHKYRLCTT